MKTIDNLLKSKTIIRFFLLLIAVTVIMRLAGAHHISDTLTLGMMGFVAGLIALHNNDKRNNTGI